MRVVLLNFFILISINVSAQIDKTFWFAAPDIDIANFPQNGPYDRPIYLIITSLSVAANITISIPANAAFTPINIVIPPNTTTSVNLTTWVDLIENSNPNIVQNKGILIESTADITAYYEVNSVTCACNPELFALKGKNAIGNEFYIPSQLQWAIDTIRFPSARAAFDIVATENNTTITITPSKNLIGRNANIPFVVNLNRGQTLSNQGLYRNGSNLLNGSKIISNKPIAITTKEDLLFSDGPCADLAGDQLIPTSIMGEEFGIVRGNLTTRDKVVVTGTQNNTNIFLNGSPTSSANINAGQSYEIDLTTQPTLYITTNNLVNVLHYTGEGCEVGSAVIPKLNCTGSSSVSLVRSNSGSGTVLIIIKNGNQGNFSVNGNIGAIVSGDFSPLIGTGGNYVYCKKDISFAMPFNTATKISNTTGRFQLGFINGEPGGTMYGYFSDFKKSNVTSTQLEVCALDSAQLNAFGGTNYQWTPTTGLSNANISNPKASPNTTTDYKVVITDVDGCIDSAFVKVVVNNCTTLTCNNWLKTQAVGQSVTVGDLDISGNQVTVEANFNCSSFPINRPDKWEDIVSKHSNTTDANYVLRMDLAAITTTNGHYLTPAPCDNLLLNKTYHVAFVYDGNNLKLYRNGFLISQIPAIGNLILNNLLTTIGDYAINLPVGTNFLGYINEVRIWNVARTQAELRTYMNTSLPNPTTQVGLKGYYTFDNLLNKQGNTTFNGTLNGGAVINATNPNCTFVVDSCNVIVSPTTCKNSLEFKTITQSNAKLNTSAGSNIKELYNSNNFTWECDFKLKGPIVNQSLLMSTEDAVLFQDIFLGFGWGGTANALSFLISDDGTNNITASTSSLQSLNQNQWYRITAVCDYTNAQLKLYLNGNLISSNTIPTSILQHRLDVDRLTWIGNASAKLSTGNFLIDDIRYWKKARTIAEIQNDYANCLTLPNTDLVAYFKANEGSGLTTSSIVNASFTTTLENTNWNADNSTNCLTDSCNFSTEIIINDYTPVLSLDPCKNILNVGNASAYNVGDTVLLIQMKGAIIDSTNTAAFGTITDYKSAGNYEYNYVKSRIGNQIELKNKILRTYEIPNGKVQLIRVPYYQNYSTTSTLTCLPWDGTIGGVLVFNVANTLTLNNNIDVSGKGFKGGVDPVTNPPVFNCGENQFYYPQNPDLASGKGEGIADISAAKSFGKGALANGGGGGNSHNSAGGGGGNGAVGGLGGYQFEGSPCTGQAIDSRGIGGKLLTYNNAANKIFLGGGGGAGHSNNFENFQALGGNGSGIILISANSLQSNNNKILANGAVGVPCGNSGSGCHEGMGGGGAGGSTLLNITTYLDNISCETKGGKGADMQSAGNLRVGPGGGGGAGILWLKQNAIPASVTSVNTGGLNGVCTAYANDTWGSTPGQAGQTLFNLNLPITTIPFRPNIDSVKINVANTTCFAFNFSGLGFTNTNPISTWQWSFGDNTTGTGQNVSHTYLTSNTFIVKLVVTDINGCKDSITRSVTTLCPTEIIINEYTPVLSLDPCKNILNVGNASAYNVGDTVLLIQMKGAIIDSTNTAAFGTITDYKSAGNYEYNYVKSKTGNQIELKNKILRTYEISNGKVQLIRVPYYQNYATTSTLTCLPWNGTIGGVLVFNVANTLTLNNDIDVSEKGFKGGRPENFNSNTANCNSDNFFYPLGNVLGAAKGEGIAEIGISKQSGKGRLANGGGGGNDHNAGGGGGSNSTLGGAGGKEYNGCTITGIGNGGISGQNLNNNGNKIFLGGGGGSGHANNSGVNYFTAAGGNGGGIVIINSNILNANGFKIINNGANAAECIAGGNCNDGAGGGGSGGSILLNINTYSSPTSINANGGRGASTGTSGTFITGPGGGGSGGMIWLKQNSTVTNAQANYIGGINGVNLTQSNNPWGATSGQAGQTIFNLNLPITTIPFKPNIDSVKINAANTTCSNYNFSGLGYTNTNPIATWQWYFGDGATATGQNTSHNYTTTNTFTVKLVITDINGCKDSITRNITTNSIVVDAGIDKTFCGAQTGVSLTGTSASAGTSTYAWTSVPVTTITNASSLTPSANVNTTTTFYITVTSSLGCSGVDSIKVIINPIPIVQTLNDVAICKGTSLQLTTTLGLNTYQWSNGIYVSDSTIANPIFFDTVPRILIVTGSNGLCSAKDTINISIKPLPFVKTIKDTLICSTQNISLTTTGASTYSWTPSTFLSNTGSSNPTYMGTGASNTSTTYYVTGTAANGCIAKDTVVVNMNVPNSFIAPPNKSFCKKESIQLDGNNGNTVTYNWQPPIDISNINIINPIVNPASSTVYTVNITDPVCTYSKTFTVIVTVNPLPTITISKSSDITCSNFSAKLNAAGASTYTWNTATTLSNINIPNPIANPTTNTTYTVTGIDANGCKNNNKISVFVSLGKNVFDLPNTFTPNADTKNDCFGAINWGYAQEVYFIIYNRWGEKIFETNNINTCWNGEYKGKPAIEGNYVYYIRAKTACGDVVKKGNVLLIR
jgi:gliding motility-associated-like protein